MRFFITQVTNNGNKEYSLQLFETTSIDFFWNHASVPPLFSSISFSFVSSQQLVLFILKQTYFRKIMKMCFQDISTITQSKETIFDICKIRSRIKYGIYLKHLPFFKSIKKYEIIFSPDTECGCFYLMKIHINWT